MKQKPEIRPHIYGQLTFDKDTKITKRRVTVFSLGNPEVTEHACAEE